MTDQPLEPCSFVEWFEETVMHKDNEELRDLVRLHMGTVHLSTLDNWIEAAWDKRTRAPIPDEAARVAELEKQVRAWKVEADRVRNAHDATSSYSENMSIAEIIDWLKEHRFTHSDWASWFEQHPKDPRIKSGLGTADFHRKVEARYNSYISALEKTDARIAELEADLKQSRNDALDEAYFVCTERRDMLDDMDDVNCCVGTAKVCAADIEALKSGEEG